MSKKNFIPSNESRQLVKFKTFIVGTRFNVSLITKQVVSNIVVFIKFNSPRVLKIKQFKRKIII